MICPPLPRRAFGNGCRKERIRAGIFPLKTRWRREGGEQALANTPRRREAGQKAERAGSKKAPSYLFVGLRTHAEAVMPERTVVARRATAYVAPASGAEQAVPTDGAPGLPGGGFAADAFGSRQPPAVQTAVLVGAFAHGTG